MAISISVLILAIGLISLFTLPVEQYPDIAPPTVYVTASYTGADAEAVMNSVIMPLEESINGVEDMMYISSSPKRRIKNRMIQLCKFFLFYLLISFDFHTFSLRKPFKN
mgnify:CR=1 FL=1